MSEAPEELWADWDYEAIDGVCGVHTQKRFASGYEPECPPIRYVRADRIEELEAKLAKAVEALQWCSGSADFNDGGIARKGWLKLCAPLIAELKGETND